MKKIAFNFSIGELCQRSDNLQHSYTRDETAFMKYGYDTSANQKLGDNTSKLKLIPSDDFFMGQQTLATDAKNQAKEALITNIYDLKSRVKLVYGLSSVEYNLFKFNKLNSLADSELIPYSYHVVRTAEPRLSELAKRMVTQESLDTLMANRETLDTKIDTQAAAISERREKSIERISLSNAIYEQVKELSEVGKLIWNKVNDAFYTDYVIYGSSKSIEDQTEEIEAAVN